MRKLVLWSCCVVRKTLENLSDRKLLRKLWILGQEIKRNFEHSSIGLRRICLPKFLGRLIIRYFLYDMASFWAGILIIHHHSICHDLWHLVLIHCGGWQPSPSLALSLRWWRLRQKSFMMLERYNRLQSSEIDKHVKETFYHNLSLDMLDHFDSF